jgi:hypothetical protein
MVRGQGCCGIKIRNYGQGVVVVRCMDLFNCGYSLFSYSEHVKLNDNGMN